MTNLHKGLNFCLMKGGRAVVALLIPLMPLMLAAGCVSSSLHKETVADMERQIVELKRSQADEKARLDELNNRFLLLQERVEEDRRVVDNLRRMTLPVTPPKELKVVKLSAMGKEEKKRGEQKAEKKEAEKKMVTTGGDEAEDIYHRAQDLFWAGKLNDAADVFQRFANEYPQHHLADNALYWIGEVYYSQQKYRRALEEFQGLISHYPKGNKAPDALLKIAYSYIELDDENGAEEALMRLVNAYPGSEPVKKARVKIKELYMNRRGEQ
ncbi:MAG: tol-pal system protein YbgF [Thermodesulfobacteriota bacterium]